MWYGASVLSFAQLNLFEKHFQFTFDPALHTFLLEHNGGSVSPGVFPTAVRERRLVKLLDFSSQEDKKGAWQINAKHRNLITEKRIIIGTDDKGNYVCVEQDYRHQMIVVWNHLTDSFEPCLWEIPAFLKYIG